MCCFWVFFTGDRLESQNYVVLLTTGPNAGGVGSAAIKAWELKMLENTEILIIEIPQTSLPEDIAQFGQLIDLGEKNTLETLPKIVDWLPEQICSISRCRFAVC